MNTLQLDRFSTKQRSESSGISRVAIQGYKSIFNQCSIDLSYLTVIAGSNSSGKSSLFQPLLILKQTLESPFDPGSLLINGDSVNITSLDQLLSHVPDHRRNRNLIIELELHLEKSVRLTFSEKQKKQGLKIIESCYEVKDSEKVFVLKKELSQEHLVDLMQNMIEDRFGDAAPLIEVLKKYSINPLIEGSCFFDLGLTTPQLSLSIGLFNDYANEVRRIIHVSGIRRNPERTYQKTAIGPEFSGAFDKYVASVILAWKTEQKSKFKQLNEDLAELGLTWKIDARQLDDSQLELLVGRGPTHGSSRNKKHKPSDTVNIADVGFGVSQVLPVLVALLVAEPGQLVYIEQPEIHLHPKAQVALAKLLVRAALRKVRVVVETHSSILLLAIQSLVAEGELPPSDTYLHWVSRDPEGITEVSSQQLDETGAFGDWPEDFADTMLDLNSRYLDAVENTIFG
ncbi:MAG: AAA family ATPase [Limnothrix sp. BL-A-16]